MLYPLKFKPILKEKIWGGRRLGEKLGKRLPAGRAVGESWELSGLDGNRSVVRNGPLKGNDLEELIEVYMGELVGDRVYERTSSSGAALLVTVARSRQNRRR